MDYQSVFLHPVIEIYEIYTIHYFEYMSDFNYTGESHNFWEFVCVDKGEIEVTAGTQTLTLHKGDILFHKPNEFHSIKANGKIAPNLVVISFACHSPSIQFFENKLLSINDVDRSLLAQIIAEARNCYSSRLDDPYLTMLEPSEQQLFGAEQLIKGYLEQLLILLVRRYTKSEAFFRLESPLVRKKNNAEIHNRILLYLEQNVHNRLTIDQIAKDNLIGRSQLQKLFRDKNGCGIIEYFCQLKINEAKQLIRNNNLNFTQISDLLGYTSIHYFSRQFKKIVGMTPSEYASSINLLTEKSTTLEKGDTL